MATEPAVTPAAPAEGGGAAPAGAKPKGKTIGGLPAPVVIAGGIAFALAAGYFLLHRGQSASSAAGGTDSTAGGAAGSPDDSAALSDIEQQLADLNGSLGQLGGGASGGGGSDGGGGVIGTTGDGGGTGTGTGTGTGSGSGGTGSPTKGVHWTTVGGKGATRDLYQIAKDNGISEAELLRLNPQLKKYSGSRKPIPKRTRIIV